MLQCSKRYDDLPAGHRAPRHDGHCKQLHGHNYSFEFVFNAHDRDDNGFVVDFGKLTAIKQMLNDWFDHTLLISETDPELPYFEEMNLKGLCDIRVIPDTSAEGMAKFVFDNASNIVATAFNGRVWLSAVRVWEDSRNSAIFSK